MRLLGRRPLVGAYVCPHGVYAAQLARGRGGYSIVRSVESDIMLGSAAEATDALVRVLRDADLEGAEVVVTLRGFGLVHHVLQMPPATDDILDPVVEREMRRLEPQLSDPVVSWVSLPAMRAVGPEAPADQRSILAVAAPALLLAAFEQRLRASGFQLLHVTGLPVAMQRLVEEFEPNSETAGFVSPLPDGAFLGFALDGALRLVIEPHLPQDAEHELSALAEESQHGVIFVRQQFRGAHVDHLTLVGSKHSLRDGDAVLSERVGVPVHRFPIRDLTPAGYAALGGLFDARSPNPLSLGGETRLQRAARASSLLENLSYAGVAAVILLAGWVSIQSYRASDAAATLRETRDRVARDSIALSPIRSVAAQRRAAHDAEGAMIRGARDRADLRRAIAAIAYAVRPPVELDSLHLLRAPDGWSVALGGRVGGESSARAVQWLHDLYREIPRRLRVDSVRLDQLTYDETTESQSPDATVRFQLSFGVPMGARD